MKKFTQSYLVVRNGFLVPENLYLHPKIIALCALLTALWTKYYISVSICQPSWQPFWIWDEEIHPEIFGCQKWIPCPWKPITRHQNHCSMGSSFWDMAKIWKWRPFWQPSWIFDKIITWELFYWDNWIPCPWKPISRHQNHRAMCSSDGDIAEIVQFDLICIIYAN